MEISRQATLISLTLPRATYPIRLAVALINALAKRQASKPIPAKVSIKKVSRKSAGDMVKKLSSKHPPAEYKVGSEVLVRRFSSKCRKRAGKKSASKATRVLKGRVVDSNLENGTYKVCYFLVDKEVEEWFKVSDLTSMTLEEENKKHGRVLGNKHTMLANQLPTTVHLLDNDYQTSSENTSTLSCSKTTPHVCPSSELQLSTSTPQGIVVSTLSFHYY